MKKRSSPQGAARPGSGDKLKTPGSGVRPRPGKSASRTPAVPSKPVAEPDLTGVAQEGGRAPAAPAESRREVGAEIGALRRRGMPLAVKFSIYISLLILIVSALFGLVVIRLFQNQIRLEIVASGEQQTLMLATLGRNAYHEICPGGQPVQDYQERAERYSKDLKRLNPDGNGRALDACILTTTVPKMLIASMRGKPVDFTPPDKNDTIRGSVDKMTIWPGDYFVEKKPTRVVFFEYPVEGAPISVYLVLSTREIDDEVRSLVWRTALFGLLFVGAGVALSLWLAGLITNPINLLVRDMDIVSRGDLDHEARPHSTDEVGLLAMAFNRMTASLREASEHQRESDRLNSELNMAKEIQANLMPDRIPAFPGYDICATYMSAKEVGGDYYDLIPVDRTHLALVAADASGKGIGAAMIMANARTVLRMVCVGNLSAADTLSKTNAVLTRDLKRGTFITVFYALLDVPNRELTVCSAGHDPMILYRAATGRCESIHPNCVAIGFDKGPIFDKTVKEQKIKLFKGDRVVLYTDGVVESMNAEHEQWGFDNLYAFVREHAQMRSKDFLRQLERALHEHQGEAEQHDDITIVTFRVE